MGILHKLSFMLWNQLQYYNKHIHTKVLRHVIQCFFLIIGGQFRSIVPVCVCPGDNLTYICSSPGQGFTLWKGSALQCPSHQILLLHRNYEPGTCGSGTAQGVSVTGSNNYTSLLNIRFDDSLNDTDIECYYDDGTTQTYIGSAVITSAGI